MRRASLPPSWSNYSGASYRLPPAASASAACAEVLPANFRVSLSLFSVHTLSSQFHQNRRHETIFHHHVCNRLSHLLHRLRQPARRKCRKEKCHLDLRHLRCDLQRFACEIQWHSERNLTESLSDTSSKTVVTHSKPTAFPSALRAKRSEVQTLNDDDVQTSVLIEHTCEKCGREEVRYYTQQLRGADEGTTVFYQCDCGHKYVNGTNAIRCLLTIALRWNTNN
jgi:DNA-directed RNA polymerase subunit M/transcription elongation factor TFIIS